MPGVGKGQVAAGRTGAGADGAKDGAAAGLAAGLAAGFLTATFLAAGFLAATFLAAGFFAATFLAAGFFAATFLAAGFFAAGFLAAGLAFFAATMLNLLYYSQRYKSTIEPLQHSQLRRLAASRSPREGLLPLMTLNARFRVKAARPLPCMPGETLLEKAAD